MTKEDYVLAKSNAIVTKHQMVYLYDGIVIQEYKPILKKINLEIAKEIVTERTLICRGRNYPLMTISKNVTGLDEDARKYFSSEEAAYLICAFGLVVSNPFAKLLGNFFLKFGSLKEPVKLFTSQDKALNWLKPFRYLN